MSATAVAAAPVAPSAPAVPVAATAPASVPVNATIQAETAIPSTPASSPSDDRMENARLRAFSAARDIDRAERAPQAQASDVAAQVPPAVVTPPADATPTGDKPPEVVKPPRAETVTARIADLTRRNREFAQKAAAAEARAAETAAKFAAAEAKAAESAAALDAIKKAPDKFEAIKARFAEDPLVAFSELGHKWEDIVVRVANGGLPPTPEQVAAAEAERTAKAKEAERAKAESERDARLAALEADRKAEKEAADAAKKARDDAARADLEAKQTEGAINYVSTQLITPERHPFLVNIAVDAAAEALAEVDAAMLQAFKEGRRAKPHPESMEESVHFTTLALDGVNSYYRDLATRIAPQAQSLPPQSPQQTGETSRAATVAPAVNTESAQQRRPVGTITNAVAGEAPQAAQPQRLSTEEARARAIEAARRLPTL